MKNVMLALWMWLAWKLPKSLAYWATIRLMVNATTGTYGAEETPKVTMAQVLDRWTK